LRSRSRSAWRLLVLPVATVLDVVSAPLVDAPVPRLLLVPLRVEPALPRASDDEVPAFAPVVAEVPAAPSATFALPSVADAAPTPRVEAEPFVLVLVPAVPKVVLELPVVVEAPLLVVDALCATATEVPPISKAAAVAAINLFLSILFSPVAPLNALYP
jgi:hypothetical protein